MVGQLELKGSEEEVFAANGTRIATVGSVEVPLHGAGMILPTEALVTTHVKEPILGIDWILKHGVVIDLPKGSVLVRGKALKLERKGDSQACRMITVKKKISKGPGQNEDRKGASTESAGYEGLMQLFLEAPPGFVDERQEQQEAFMEDREQGGEVEPEELNGGQLKGANEGPPTAYVSPVQQRTGGSLVQDLHGVGNAGRSRLADGDEINPVALKDKRNVAGFALVVILLGLTSLLKLASRVGHRLLLMCRVNFDSATDQKWKTAGLSHVVERLRNLRKPGVRRAHLVDKERRATGAMAQPMKQLLRGDGWPGPPE